MCRFLALVLLASSTGCDLIARATPLAPAPVPERLVQGRAAVIGTSAVADRLVVCTAKTGDRRLTGLDARDGRGGVPSAAGGGCHDDSDPPQTSAPGEGGDRGRAVCG